MITLPAKAYPMASLLASNSLTFTNSLPPTRTRASFGPSHVPIPPAIRFAGHRKTGRGLGVVTRAGPSAQSYIFAFVFPLTMLAVTIFTSIRIADKLDRDYLEELEINQAIREAEEEDDDDDNDDGDDDDGINIPIEEEVQEPVLQRTRTRNRPKRVV